MADGNQNTQMASQAGTRLREEEHDRELHEVRAIVEAITRPSRSILRVSARLVSSTDDPNWSQPNVAFRIHLGADYGGISRIYTVRDYDGSGCFTFDVVLHEGESPMMRWTSALAIGDSFELTGPRPHLGIPEAMGRKVALFLDETGIPALHSLLRQWPAGITGKGWVATKDAEAFAELPQIEGLALMRIDVQDDAEADVLLSQAKRMADAAGWAVWGAGERREMRSIRQHFVGLGLNKQDLAIAGYWRRGVSNTEIDERRKQDYQRVLARGGTLADYDDLAVEV
ncbi:SIP domain-containing protein [Novosphingobium sp. BL-8A]|uniref:siderophore-interacting protein n=1 Tax=Novosphingobium sp. BL-8A TaxID=3127639 RepID=UPI00375671F8